MSRSACRPPSGRSVIPGAILSPEAAVAYAQRIFAAAASACRQAQDEPLAGHA